MGRINGHEYVDLGLSVRWATCNVGANNPEDYGDYYAWGETKTKKEYTEENCETYKNIGDIKGTSRDVAHVRWGSPWRMPTEEESQELIDNCDWEWTTLNGVEGSKVTSRKNGNSIFLPAAGWRYGTSLSTPERAVSIGVPRPTGAVPRTRTTSTSTVAITSGTGTTATTGYPSVRSQNFKRSMFDLLDTFGLFVPAI